MAEPESADNVNPSSPEPLAGNDLDGILDEAVGMATNLRNEIGDPEPATPSAKPSDESGTEPSASDVPAGPDPICSSAPVEEQLDRVEDLVEETSAQLGEDAAEPPVAERKGTAVYLPPKGSSTSDSGPKRSDDASPAGDIATLAIETGIAAGQQTETAGTGSAPPAPTTGLGRAADMGAAALCAILDLFDRPFSRVPYGVRQVLGLCALGTLLAALATFIISRI